MPTYLKKELETYQRELPKLLKRNKGKYVVIKKDKILGIKKTYGDALEVGYKLCGLDSFLVRKIGAVGRTFLSNKIYTADY